MAMPPKKKPVAQQPATMPMQKKDTSPKINARASYKKSLNEGMNETANKISSSHDGVSKTRKRLFGGTVTVTKGKKYDNEGYSRSKSKIVVDKKGNITKTVYKKDKYLPTGNESGRLSESRKVSSTKTTKKYNDGSNKPSSVRVKTKLSNKKNG